MMKTSIPGLLIYLVALIFSLQEAKGQQKYQLAYLQAGDVSLNPDSMHFVPYQDHRDIPATNRSGTYLFRITLDRQLLEGDVSMFIENEHLDTVVLYYKSGGLLVPIDTSGNDFEIRNRRLGFPGFYLSAQHDVYYLKTSFSKDVSFPIHLDAHKGLNHRMLHLFFKLGMYYGACMLFFVFNLGLFIYLRDRIFVYYCLFQLFIVCSVAYADGLFPFLLSSRWLLRHADLFLHLGLAIAGSVFARTLLEIRPTRFRNVLNGAVLILIALSFLFSILLNSYGLFILGETMTFLLLTIFLAIGMMQFGRHRYSRFFVIGYGCFLLFAIDYFLLRKLGIFWLDWFPAQLKLGSIIETLVLSLAVILRFRSLQEQNDYFRQQIQEQMWQVVPSLSERSVYKDVFERIQQKYKLTDRELEVLQGISEGLANQQIADRMFVSVSTVKFHTRNIFEKMKISSRTQALARLHQDEPK